METKICKGGKVSCGIEKPLYEFKKDKKMKDGHLNQCKVCCNSKHIKFKEIFPEGMKKCSNPECNEIKPLSEFHISKTKKIGYNSRCKSCRSTAKPKENLPDGIKRCTAGKVHCNEIKPIEEFYIYDKVGVKRINQCKNCKNAESKQKRIENPPPKIQKPPKEIFPDGYKRCRGECNEIKIFSNFYKRNDDTTTDGYRDLCKKCMKYSNLQWRKNNPDYTRNRYRNDPIIKILNTMRGHVKKDI